MKYAGTSGDDWHKIDTAISANHPLVQSLFTSMADVEMRMMTFGDTHSPQQALFLYSLGMINMESLNRDVLPNLHLYFLEHKERLSARILEATLPVSLQAVELYHEPLVTHVFRGMLVIFFDGVDAAFVLDISQPPVRQPEEPGTEISVYGPKDGLVEEVTANIALVRKRLPTNSLSVQMFSVGERTHTAVALLYINDVIDADLLLEVQRRISLIQIDGLYASAQLEELLTTKKNRLVPLFALSGRPDFIAGSLLRGRFAILVDGTPSAVLGPTNLAFLFQSGEDEYMLSSFLVLQRALRYFGMILGLILPGLYIAIVSYHIDRIPLILLGTFITSHRGVPFTTPQETMMMLLLFEMLREAGNRLPGGLGQTLAVVGGLIIGEAAIEAGLTSPTVLVITGATAVASFTISYLALAGAITLFRIFIVILASIFGEYGFVIGLFAVIVYLSNVRSFGVPFLAPLSPFRRRDITYAFNSATANQPRKRPTILRTKDNSRG